MYPDDKGELTYAGIDVSVAQYIADDMGLSLQVENMAFEYLLTSLGKGDFDMVLAAMEATPDQMCIRDSPCTVQQFATTKCVFHRSPRPFLFLSSVFCPLCLSFYGSFTVQYKLHRPVCQSFCRENPGKPGAGGPEPMRCV